MALELDPDWPGLEEDKSGNYADRTEIKRIAGELGELLKKLTTSSGRPVTEFLIAPGEKPPEPEIPAGAGSLPDLQVYCALSQNQLGEWPTAMQFGMTVNYAFSSLVGEQGSTSGLYASLVQQAEKSVEALYDIAKVSQGAEHASEEAAARQEV